MIQLITTPLKNRYAKLYQGIKTYYIFIQKYTQSYFQMRFLRTPISTTAVAFTYTAYSRNKGRNFNKRLRLSSRPARRSGIDCWKTQNRFNFYIVCYFGYRLRQTVRCKERDQRKVSRQVSAR